MQHDMFLRVSAKQYLQRIIRGARYEPIPEPLVSWLPQDVA